MTAAESIVSAKASETVLVPFWLDCSVFSSCTPSYLEFNIW